MEKLYYVVEKESTGDPQNGEYLTGNKDISLYNLVLGDMNLITVINVENDVNSVEAIKEYIEEREIKGFSSFQRL